MSDPRLTRTPIVRTGMLIRRPAAEVFEAFVDPHVTTRFWFTGSSGRLEPGAEVAWEWAMYGASAPVRVLAVEPLRRIAIEWPGDEGPTVVEWRFTELADGTFVEITNHGLTGDGDSLVRQVMDLTGGFCWVLAGAKAWLEHGIALGLVLDRLPEGIPPH